jgi:hypothetical protein
VEPRCPWLSNAPAQLRANQIRALAVGERNPKTARLLQRTLGDRWALRDRKLNTMKRHSLGDGVSLDEVVELDGATASA